ncbi:MAG: hypothetical protein CMK70_15865 [Pseudohongiella sp.]|nr:hypothetical protein [Pseudohongiella sp.]
MLFREEALLFSRGSRFGDGVLYQPVTVRLMVTGALMACLMFVLFATFAKFKQVERVRGYLSPVVGESKVYANNTGTISAINISEGDLVEAGQVLMTISAPGYDNKGNNQLEAQMALVDSQIQILKQRQVNRELQTRIELKKFNSRTQGLVEELKIAEQAHRLLEQRLEIVDSDYNKHQKLFERDLISRRELDRIKSEQVALHQQSKASEAELLTRESALLDSTQQLEMVQAQSHDQQLSLAVNLLQLQQRRAELHTLSAQSIVAPVSGIIDNLMYDVGESVDARLPLLTILPEILELEAHLYLPSRAIGELRTGQELMMSYDAFPYQLYGTHSAEVARISGTVIDPREHLIPLEVNEPVYLVRANIEGVIVHAGTHYQLQPGMQFTADVVTGEETLMQRITRPLSSVERRL